jgi:hypothetical protein
VETAERALAECLALAIDLGMRPLHARVLLTRGELLQRLGRHEEARTTIADAAGGFTALGMTSWAAVCDALAGPMRV